jgi:hypothetical protein
MSNKKSVAKYLEPITDEEIDSLNKKYEEVKKANRKKKPLKIDQVAPTVVKCLLDGMSSRRICNAVWSKHKLRIGKDAVLRFSLELKSKGYVF